MQFQMYILLFIHAEAPQKRILKNILFHLKGICKLGDKIYLKRKSCEVEKVYSDWKEKEINIFGFIKQNLEKDGLIFSWKSKRGTDKKVNGL